MTEHESPLGEGTDPKASRWAFLRKPWVLVAGGLVVAAVIGGVVWGLNQPSDATATSPSSANTSGATTGNTTTGTPAGEGAAPSAEASEEGSTNGSEAEGDEADGGSADGGDAAPDTSAADAAFMAEASLTVQQMIFELTGATVLFDNGGAIEPGYQLLRAQASYLRGLPPTAVLAGDWATSLDTIDKWLNEVETGMNAGSTAQIRAALDQLNQTLQETALLVPPPAA